MLAPVNHFEPSPATPPRRTPEGPEASWTWGEVKVNNPW